MNKFVELLAPAGSPESFYGAISAGADAVYLAGTQYGARAYADNFPEEELLKALRYAHLFHKKVYMTVNTLTKEQELEALPAFLKPYVEEGLDGVIVQDFGVLSRLGEVFPRLPLHASTQMSITGAYGANLLKELGVTRIVPARELSLFEVKKLKEESGLEIECFIHGAMCYCYSGQCLFSSMLGGRSGNRGRCAQPCRLPYRVSIGGKTTKEAYPLSLKDMCTIENIPELIEAGIDSFKIEGRMKKPEYAAGVTAYYRKYIDAYYEGRMKAPSAKDLKDLSNLYIRSERTNGYYHRQNGQDMITLQSPAYQASDEHLLSQIHEKYLSTKKALPIHMEAELLVGQPAKLSVWSASAPSKKVTVWGNTVESAQKAPITSENVLKQLSKLGDTAFALDSDPIDLNLDDSAFYPLKGINELRRDALQKLEEVLTHA
ncbi:MAG: U32 family peptidase [Acetatifactor sp.]|nr:U32 family peptidase [Acetatifactor sp.]